MVTNVTTLLVQKSDVFRLLRTFLENRKLTLIRLMGSFTQPDKFGRPGVPHKHATGIENFNISTKKSGNKSCSRKTSKFGSKEKEPGNSDFIYR